MLDLLSKFMLDTPDFGHSDIWHQNFAFRHLLSTTLKNGYLPFWSKDIGMGFPLLAEGQTGMFSLSNLLLFRFFDPVTATNLTYLVIFITTFIGSVLYGRVIKLSKITAFYLATIFTFSGLMITQMRAIHLVQAVSFLPLEFYLAEKMIQTPKKRWVALFALILSQQIFASYEQIVVISMIATAVYLLIRMHQLKTLKPLAPFGISAILGIVIALPQIIPSLQMIRLSARAGGVAIQEIVRFPYNPKHLLSFFNPYLFGDPRQGTYPPFSDNWGIFWESTGYIGVIPLFLIILLVFHKRLRHLRNLFLVLIITSGILMLGKFTPFFFVFLFPPLSSFRVPARFLIPFVWSLVILAAIGFDRIKPKFLIIPIFVFSIIDLARFDLTYHAVVNAQSWLEKPKAAQILQNDKNWHRIYTLAPYNQWNDIFLKHGWQDMTAYRQFRNALDGSQNLYWQIPSLDYYAGLSTRRLDLFKGLIDNGISVSPEQNTFSLSTESGRLLSQASVKYLISPYTYNRLPGTDPLELTASISGQPAFFIYQNPNALPHAYLTKNFLVARTIVDLKDKVSKAQPGQIILEKEIGFASQSGKIEEANVTLNSDLEVRISINAQQSSLLVLTDSYYPDWRVYLDGHQTEILPANINERAVIVPSGKHEVIFRFSPLQIF